MAFSALIFGNSLKFTYNMGMKKILIPFIIVLACVGLYFAKPFFSKSQNPKQSIGEADEGKIYYYFQSLPEDLAA